jgi:hypothetical protein
MAVSTPFLSYTAARRAVGAWIEKIKRENAWHKAGKM